VGAALWISRARLEALREAGEGLLSGWMHERGASVGSGDDGAQPIGWAAHSPHALRAAGPAVWLDLREPLTAAWVHEGVWRPLALEVVDTASDHFARTSGLVRRDVLAQARVVLVGVGSVGSVVASALAQQGVGGLDLFDVDELTPPNLARHLLDLRDVGRPKVFGVAEAVRRINPDAVVTPHWVDVLEPDSGIGEAIAGASLVVISADSFTVRREIAGLAVALGVPCVVGGFYTHAVASSIVFVVPGETACYCCLFPDPREDRTGRSDIPYAGEGQDLAAAPGLSVDIAFGTAVLNSVCLALLDRSGPRLQALHPNYSRLIAHSGLRPDPQGEFAEEFRDPFEVRFVATARRTDCAHCGSSEFARSYRKRVRAELGVALTDDYLRLEALEPGPSTISSRVTAES
jgi:molybdopterin/thiamine biosynthesis adenylyltransferase